MFTWRGHPSKVSLKWVVARNTTPVYGGKTDHTDEKEGEAFISRKRKSREDFIHREGVFTKGKVRGSMVALKKEIS